MTDLLASALAADPDRVALTDGRRTWTRHELDAAVRRAAGELAGRGAAPGGTVVTVVPPAPEAVVAVHAVLRTGALLAPLNPALTSPELAAALAALRPGLVVVGEEAAPSVREVAERAGVACETVDPAGWPTGRVDESDPGPRPGGHARPGSVAVLWTSGTSGRPRGVLLTGPALRHSAEAARRRLALGPDDRWYASLSIAHVGGLALVTRAALLGSTLVAPGPFDAADLARRIDAGDVTHASLVPVMLRRLLDAGKDRTPPPSLRCLLVGGAACPRPLLDRAVSAGMPVALTYGMTETTSQAATAPPELVVRKPGTVGPPLDGVELRTDRAGEILVRGPTLAAGLVAGDRELIDADGWFHTGDLGEVDGEGHLRVTGRRSDRIVTGGVNVDPAEVEGVLLGHPGVAEAAVVGVPDPEWGERVVAAVVPAIGSGDGLDESFDEGLGCGAGDAPDGSALRGWARERLSGAKAPKEVVVLSALPRNANGKVDRAALRELLARP